MESLANRDVRSWLWGCGCSWRAPSIAIAHALWKASDHQWGQGKLHVIGKDGHGTICGQRLDTCPGRPEMDENWWLREDRCRSCQNILNRREARRLRELAWQERLEWRRKLGGLTYQQYLRTEGWRQRRRPALYRAKGRCEICSQPEYLVGKLQVHHLTYERIGEELPSDLEALCDECHHMVHGLQDT